MRIPLEIDIYEHNLTPAQAEVWLTVRTARDAATEVRGRMMGPRCLYASTVEVAYPLRPRPGPSPDPADPFYLSSIIPEPSLWDLQSPFLYQVLVERWQDGRRCLQHSIEHGLRSFRLGSAGLAINGKAVALRGRCFQSDNAKALRLFRQQGGNLVLAPVKLDTMQLWHQADRQGLLMLGLISTPEEENHPLPSVLAQRPSCLGWVLRPSALAVLPKLLALPGGAKIGWWLEGPSPEAPPPGIHFVVVDERHRDHLTATGLPALLVCPEAPAGGAGVLGWVEQPAGA